MRKAATVFHKTPIRGLLSIFYKDIAVNILEEAQKLVTGDRNESYGDADKEFRKVAAMWTAILGADVDPRSVALCMIALKLVREAHQHKRDNLVDIAGYSLLASKSRHNVLDDARQKQAEIRENMGCDPALEGSEKTIVSVVEVDPETEKQHADKMHSLRKIIEAKVAETQKQQNQTPEIHRRYIFGSGDRGGWFKKDFYVSRAGGAEEYWNDPKRMLCGSIVGVEEATLRIRSSEWLKEHIFSSGIELIAGRDPKEDKDKVTESEPELRTDASGRTVHRRMVHSDGQTGMWFENKHPSVIFSDPESCMENDTVVAIEEGVWIHSKYVGSIIVLGKVPENYEFPEFEE